MRTDELASGSFHLGLAEKIIALLQDGSFTTTYKYAVLLGLIDLAVENIGLPESPKTFYTPQLADKIIDLYFQQTEHFSSNTSGAKLLQQVSGKGKQAGILTLISDFKKAGNPAWMDLMRARRSKTKAYLGLRNRVEWILISMPLPRLQRVGHTASDPFLYFVPWNDQIKRGVVSGYQATGQGFDNRVILKPGVAEALVRLNGLLRPLIQTEWARKVAELNSLEHSSIQDFLFHSDRIALTKIASPLMDLQKGFCFYCQTRLPQRATPAQAGARGGRRAEPLEERTAEVDHFVPWSRRRDNDLTNLVLSHHKCNNAKRDSFAAVPHLRHWLERLSKHESPLQQVADEFDWEYNPHSARVVTKSMYQSLPAGTSLWVAGRSNFESLRIGDLAECFGDES